ncbi:MAG TPA: aldo/keto reductase [Balneolaceae bacterium]|nr:aldo/keto reductase [Balneolaceae bacterium]
MKFRSFKGTEVAEVGLGTWQLGGTEWGNVSEEESMRIIQAYVDNGGNFIDTADIYGGGRSEKLIGKFLKSCDKDIHVATKLGRREDDGNGWPQNFTYDAIKKHIEDSLERLGIQQVFLDQFHCIPPEQMASGAVFEHIEKVREQGLIKHWGASVETIGEALTCLKYDGLASLQVIFNIFRQHTADKLFKKAKEKDVAIIVRVPLASGLLTGKFSRETEFSAKDHRNFNADGEAFNVGETFSGLPFKTGIQLADKVKELLPKVPMPQAALRWILDYPEVTTVIPGASKVSQIESNVQASELKPLSDDVHKRLRTLYDKEIRSMVRGEI